jgi:hypothetical protein
MLVSDVPLCDSRCTAEPAIIMGRPDGGGMMWWWRTSPDDSDSDVELGVKGCRGR